MTDYAKDDPVDTGGVVEAAHGTNAAPYFPESPLDDVGGTHLDPVFSRHIQEVEEFVQILFQASHGLRMSIAPRRDPLKVPLSGLSPTLCLID